MAGGVPIAQRGPGWTYRPDMRAPTVFGLHQPGIATPRRDHLAIAACDLDGDLRAVLQRWTALAEQAMRDGATVTIGLGSGAVPEAQRPSALRELPAFIRVAAPRSNHGAALLRRGYATEDGLLFLAFQRDPRRQFVPIQQRLARQDALARHTRHVGSAVFAIPPGAKPGGYVGGGLRGH